MNSVTPSPLEVVFPFTDANIHKCGNPEDLTEVQIATLISTLNNAWYIAEFYEFNKKYTSSHKIISHHGFYNNLKRFEALSRSTDLNAFISTLKQLTDYTKTHTDLILSDKIIGITNILSELNQLKVNTIPTDFMIDGQSYKDFNGAQILETCIKSITDLYRIVSYIQEHRPQEQSVNKKNQGSISKQLFIYCLKIIFEKIFSAEMKVYTNSMDYNAAGNGSSFLKNCLTIAGYGSLSDSVVIKTFRNNQKFVDEFLSTNGISQDQLLEDLFTSLT